MSYRNNFQTLFHSGPPPEVATLKIDLPPNAKPPFCLLLCKVTKDQQEFRFKLPSEVVEAGMVYSIPTSPWDFTPLLCPNPGTVKIWFAGDFRSISWLTFMHQIWMLNVYHELSKMAGALFSPTFYLSNGYLKFQFENLSKTLLF